MREFKLIPTLKKEPPALWWGWGRSLPYHTFSSPSIPANEVMALRAHIDEATTDPDYSMVISYEAHWDDLPPSRY